MFGRWLPIAIPRLVVPRRIIPSGGMPHAEDDTDESVAALKPAGNLPVR